MPESLLSGERLDIPPYLRGDQNTQGKYKKPMPYPSPFFDISKFYFPRSVKELFKWCRHYYKTEGLIATTVYKLAEYPVTDLIFEKPKNVEDEGIEKLKKIIEEDLGIKSFLIKIGLDYFVYGNALISIYFPFKRLFECPDCGESNQFQEFKKFGARGDLDFKDYKFKGVCPKCGKNVTFKINDIPIKQYNKINLIRYNPEHFNVSYNEITGESKYFYNIPSKIKSKIVNKDIDTLLTTPELFFEALKKKKSVQIKNSNIFHLKRADVSDDDMEWGMPLILPVMRNMFHLQVLKKAQQQIAMEHLIPLRILFPADNQSEAAPHKTTGLGVWKQRVEQEIRKWRRDPNYMPIMPVPLGNTTVSGDGKMLLLSQEMKMEHENIINGMGVPQEFVFGGLSWSGSSISLRMLENHFLVYRKELLELIRFIINKIASFLKTKTLSVKMQEFKMADDIQRKQLLQQLNESYKISDKTFIKEVVGLDAESEAKQMIKDMKKKKELFELQGLEQGILQGKVQEMIARAQVVAQQKANDAQQKGENEKAPSNFMGMWSEFVEMLKQEEAMKQAEEENPEEEMQTEQDPEVMAAKYAKELIGMDEQRQQQVLSQLQQQMPEMYQLIYSKFQELQQVSEMDAPLPTEQQPTGENSPVDMRPNPEKKPPRRENKTI